jgi:hypothetical protein
MVFLELTHKADGKPVVINMSLVRLVYPMANGTDLIFDPHHTASVAEDPTEILQRLGGKKRAQRTRRPSVDATLEALADAAKDPPTK